MASSTGIVLTLLCGPGRADDTGLTTPTTPVAAVAAPAPASIAGWPPDSLPTIPMPGNPAVKVRAPGARTDRGDAFGLSLRTSSAWPDWVEKGYQPIHIELDEQQGKARELTLTLERSYQPSIGRITREITLDAGAHLALDLAVPGFGPGQPTYDVIVVDHAREGALKVFNLGAPSWAGPTRDELLMVGRTLPELGALDRYTSATPYMLWSAATFDDLPRGVDAVAAWTSLDVVVLDVTAGFPAPDVLDPLLTWVRMGGALVLAGPAQAPPPAIAAWMQPRFRSRILIGLDQPVYEMGLGRLAWYEAARPDWDAPKAQALVIALQADGEKRSLIPDPDRQSDPWFYTAPEDLTLRLRGNIAAIMLLVALILGPLNLGVVHLSRRPALLLVSTPVLAVLCSLLLVAWGLLRNGLDLKATSHTFTLLDQRSGEAITIEGRSMYAGRAVASGLRPGPGTLVLPGRVDDDEGSYLFEGADDRRISGSRFLPVRETTQLVLFSARATPRRLEVQGQTVRNALGAPILELIVADAQGACWRIDQLADGGTGQLNAISAADAIDRAWQLRLRGLTGLGTRQRTWEPMLERGTYVAIVGGQPFRDDLGLTMVDQAGIALVQGILETP